MSKVFPQLNNLKKVLQCLMALKEFLRTLKLCVPSFKCKEFAKIKELNKNNNHKLQKKQK